MSWIGRYEFDVCPSVMDSLVMRFCSIQQQQRKVLRDFSYISLLLNWICAFLEWDQQMLLLFGIRRNWIILNLWNNNCDYPTPIHTIPRKGKSAYTTYAFLLSIVTFLSIPPSSLSLKCTGENGPSCGS